MKQHIMIDLETLSLRPTAVILAIGACAFNLDEVAEPFEVTLNVNQQKGRHIDPSTVIWWMQQSDKAREIFSRPTTEVGQALAKLNDYIGTHCPAPELVEVWGNGSDFDNVLLTDLYIWFNKRSSINVAKPWGHYGNRCFRTLKNLSPHYEGVAKSIARVTHHNAADDARWQANVARLLLVKMDREHRFHQAATA